MLGEISSAVSSDAATSAVGSRLTVELQPKASTDGQSCRYLVQEVPRDVSRRPGAPAVGSSHCASNSGGTRKTSQFHALLRAN